MPPTLLACEMLPREAALPGWVTCRVERRSPAVSSRLVVQFAPLLPDIATSCPEVHVFTSLPEHDTVLQLRVVFSAWHYTCFSGALHGKHATGGSLIFEEVILEVKHDCDQWNGMLCLGVAKLLYAVRPSGGVFDVRETSAARVMTFIGGRTSFVVECHCRALAPRHGDRRAQQQEHA